MLEPTAGARGRITSADVARAAGVSRATVSYVLNDTPGQRIPDATRNRVRDAARRLEYAPSAAARALRSGRSDLVLWLMPDWPIGPGIGRILDQLAAALEEVGFTLVVHPQTDDRGPSSRVWRSISPRAVILWEPPDPAAAAAMRAAGAEVVLAMRGTAGNPTDQRTLGQDATLWHTGRLQVEHLSERGHQRLGYAYPDDPRLWPIAEPRLAGVRHTCAELGLPAPEPQTVPLDPSGAAEAVDRWRAGPDPVTAVCSFNDEVALAVLAGMRARGLRAPGDLAVVGVDDLPFARLADPPLTSVGEDTSHVVDHTVSVLVAELRGDPPPAPTGSGLLHLVDRQST